MVKTSDKTNTLFLLPTAHPIVYTAHPIVLCDRNRMAIVDSSRSSSSSSRRRMTKLLCGSVYVFSTALFLLLHQLSLLSWRCAEATGLRRTQQSRLMGFSVTPSMTFLRNAWTDRHHSPGGGVAATSMKTTAMKTTRSDTCHKSIMRTCESWSRQRMLPPINGRLTSVHVHAQETLQSPVIGAAVDTASPENQSFSSSSSSSFSGAQAISKAMTPPAHRVVFTSDDIKSILPHRYPFLLVDKVVEFEPGRRAVGIKQVSVNEDPFNGHFPERAVLPGVLQVEALAQLGGIVALQPPIAKTQEDAKRTTFLFAGVDGVKWKKLVLPGDSLVMEVQLIIWKERFGFAKMTGKAFVDGELALEVKEMTFTVVK